jgi:hypothetical protein
MQERQSINGTLHCVCIWQWNLSDMCPLTTNKHIYELKYSTLRTGVWNLQWELCFFNIQDQRCVESLKLWGLWRCGAPTFLFFSLNIAVDNTFKSRSQRLRGLRRGSAATGLLGLRVRIPPEAWISVFYENCVLSGKGLCDEPITSPGGS